MFAAIALLSAVVYGAADFLGGLTSRRAGAIAIVVVSQLAGLVLLVLMLPWLPDASPSRRDLFWGGLAGLTGGAGVGLLYQALSVGTMAIVAPTTAVCAVAIPVVAAIAIGDRPGLVTVVGIALAIIAIVLVSQANDRLDRSDRSDRSGRSDRSVRLALLSGVAIGLFYLALARTSREAGVWPLVAARLVSVPLFGVLALAGRHSLRMPMGVGATAVAAGALDMLANFLYLIATRYGPLSIAVTLASLYPASTVVLARITLGERLTRAQTVGIVCALVAVALIVGSTA